MSTAKKGGERRDEDQRVYTREVRGLERLFNQSYRLGVNYWPTGHVTVLPLVSLLFLLWPSVLIKPGDWEVKLRKPN